MFVQHEVELEKQALAAAIEAERLEKEKVDTLHRVVADKNREQCRGVCNSLQDVQKELERINISSPGAADQFEQRSEVVRV